MEETLFYLLGILLVISAVALAGVGVRWRGSFPSRVAMSVGMLAVAGLVVATAAFAVMTARQEQEHRNAELAEEQEMASEEVAAEAPAGGGPPAQSQAGGDRASEGGPGKPPAKPAAPEVFDITSPSDGSLTFEPDSVQASAGEITLAYSNPSPVSHNIAIEDDQGQLLDESETISNADAEASAELAPGEYAFFCTIPGHREGGMEGVLTVE